MYRHSRIARAGEFAQAVGVARMLTTEYAELTKRTQTVGYQDVRHRGETLWRTIWEQLTIARTVARQSGRAVAPFQYAQGAITVRSINATGLYELCYAPFAHARAAIAALMAAVPEVEIPPEPSTIVPNVRLAVPWLTIAVVSAFVLLAALVVLRH